MRSRLLAAPALLLCGSIALAQQGGTPAPANPTASPGAKAAAPAAKAAAAHSPSYSLGLSMGTQLKANAVPVESINATQLAQGVHDALAGKAELGDVDRQNIQKLVQEAQNRAGDTNHKAAAAFLAENGKKQGVVTTASGLQYKVNSPGSGESPKPTDEVTVNYRGTLIDGTEFDSSYKRGQPATFPLNHVIPGWTEGVGLMKPGAKYTLYVPPQLAYDLHSPPGIPPGSLLIFDVELLSAKPEAAAGKPPAPAPAK